jgi:hypothetical protein
MPLDKVCEKLVTPATVAMCITTITIATTAIAI